jgi:hypothetical protein
MRLLLALSRGDAEVRTGIGYLVVFVLVLGFWWWFITSIQTIKNGIEQTMSCWADSSMLSPGGIPQKIRFGAIPRGGFRRGNSQKGRLEETE